MCVNVHAVACVVCADSILVWANTKPSSTSALLIKLLVLNSVCSRVLLIVALVCILWGLKWLFWVPILKDLRYECQNKLTIFGDSFRQKYSATFIEVVKRGFWKIFLQ